MGRLGNTLLDLVKRVAAPVVAVLAFVGISWSLVTLGSRLAAAGIGNDMKLPLLAIGGVLALLATLGVVALWFASFDLTDRSQPLALPEGSVRATIALCLVVLFGVISIALYSSLAESPIRSIRGLTDAQLAVFKKDTMVIELVSTDLDSTRTPPTTTVYYRSRQTKAAEDFAKQLLVLVGTLVTSVAGFYFGAKTASTAGPSAPSGPLAITAVTPQQLTRGADHWIEIAGTNLLAVTTVTLKQGPASIAASDVTSSQNSIKCLVQLGPNTPTGGWAIVALDAQGREAHIDGAVEVV